ncbi:MULTISPECIES: dihydropteroate synthase [Alkalimonas]|uniref:Dihydropteroate synthase n=1 Tax=Alkalimonas mucilaginosa TaxID=3057676 RepID=A0ABU7JAL4_9GAMM|nr:dihydropteroate synthase [Alkalimonas sp. MEB004]MEE2022741.1 dihydropteroate synthase [Alkalimonas sp. MEB004]
MQLILPRQRKLDLSHPKVMGILNVTPDSFSDGGHFERLDNALYQAEQMLQQGAVILDIGGESTRPGSEPVSLQLELDRVLPVIEGIRSRFDCVISIDTSKASVMSAAVQAGADMINDVYALRGDGALAAAAATGVPVCLMHMLGQPKTMQQQPAYQDVTADVLDFMQQRIASCVAAGIARQQLLLDPGFGFGKTLAQNYQLLQQLEQWQALQLPVLVGMSRKSMIGHLLDQPVAERLAGSLACATIAAMKGAQIIRVHDVKATVDALAVVNATLHGVEQ